MKMLNNIMSSAAHYSNPNVGVMLSGGPDSAILYYLLMKENIERRNKDTNNSLDHYNIIPLCVPKVDGAHFYAEQVNTKVCELLNISVPDILYIGNPWDRHDLIVTNAIVSCLKYDIVSRVFVADNIIPPVKLSGCEPQRIKSTYDHVKQPFFNFTKDRILDLFYTNGVSDLLKITHSCTEQSRGRCNQCWQCNERSWAFNQLGLIDPGTD